MFPLRQLAAALANVQLTSAHGPWSRAIGYRYLLGPPPGLTGPPQPLWGGAAKLAGARFTPQGAFDSIYLAHDPITAVIVARRPRPRSLRSLGRCNRGRDTQQPAGSY
ncbi:MAG: hypothetical protein NT167_29540 [Verrucomicrobia bacterium]|nr:hypothetical protein [Verrucomicrobiota bacterium]